MDKSIYKVKCVFTEPVLGTMPSDPEVWAEYIKTIAEKQGIKADDEAETLIEGFRGTTIFHKDVATGAPMLYDYQFKGFLKFAGRVLNGEDGVKGLRSKIVNTVFVFPRRIPLMDYKEITYIERPLPIEDRNGTRSAIAKSECLPAGTWFEARIEIITKQIKTKLLKTLLDYGIYQGIGQWRGGSYGRFVYELDEIE